MPGGTFFSCRFAGILDTVIVGHGISMHGHDIQGFATEGDPGPAGTVHNKGIRRFAGNADYVSYGITGGYHLGVTVGVCAHIHILVPIPAGNGFPIIHEIAFWPGACITVFLIVFIDNAINLIDGIDGLAGGLSFLALGGFLACFMRENLFTYSILISGLMGVLIPYLYFNVLGDPSKNRKIFMGDSGSLTLGFILGFLFVKFAMNNPMVMSYHKDGLILSITMLIVPMFDVVRVVLMRTYHRRPLFQADKNHIHHKLMRSGMSQHQSLIIILAVALLFAAINILFTFGLKLNLTATLTIDVVLFVIFNYVVNYGIRRHGNPVFEL